MKNNSTPRLINSLASAENMDELTLFWTQWFDKSHREAKLWPIPPRSVLHSLMIRLYSFQNKELLKSSVERVQAFLFLLDKVPPDYYKPIEARQSLENIIGLESFDNFQLIMRFLEKKELPLSGVAYFNLLDRALYIDSRYIIEPNLTEAQKTEAIARRLECLEENKKTCEARVKKCIALAETYKTSIDWDPEASAKEKNSIEFLTDSKHMALEYMCSPELLDIPPELKNMLLSAYPRLFASIGLDKLKSFYEEVVITNKPNLYNETRLDMEAIEVLRSTITQLELKNKFGWTMPYEKDNEIDTTHTTILSQAKSPKKTVKI